MFDAFNGAFQSAPFIAIAAAFGWGILSVLLSPCHLSSIPLAIGYINGRGKVGTKRAFTLALIFSAGVLITIAAIGVITGALGVMLGDIGKPGGIIVAGLFILIGVWMLDLLPFLRIPAVSPDVKGKGGVGALVLGLLFGLALGPCSFGFMMPLLLVVFNSVSADPLLSAGLLSAFALGHAGTIVLAGTFANHVQRYLNWNEKSKGALIFRRVCAALVILTGVYLLITAISKA
ncbi:MAG: cytochrome C biogenesis protein [Brevinematales bacterium]|nr:cytochrome C biogenesis protein [Brevinematales bacterium]